MKEFTGKLQGHGLRIGIVVSRFNELVTRSLLSGAIDCLCRHGVDREEMTIVWVPGAFEIALAVQHMAFSGKYDSIICLGAVIRGATIHFDLIAGQAAAGIARVAYESKIPVIFEVLTTNTLEEALERAGSKIGNKGFDGALAAIEMADLLRQMKQDSKPHKQQHKQAAAVYRISRIGKDKQDKQAAQTATQTSSGSSQDIKDRQG